MSELENKAKNLFGEAVPKTEEVPRVRLSTAEQGLEALAIIQEGLKIKDPVAVAFIDMNMPPGIDGVETARLILERDNTIEIVFVTAFIEFSLPEIKKILHKNDIICLQKPFKNREIRELGISLHNRWVIKHHKSRTKQLKQ